MVVMNLIHSEKFEGSDHNQSGLTLLEILIAVTILTILLAAIYGTYTSSVEAMQLARYNSRVYQSARIVFDRMIKDLESSIIEVPLPVKGLQVGMVGKGHSIDGMPADTIDFTSLAHLSLNRSVPRTDLCEIGYFLRKDETNGGLILYRREDWSVDKDFTEGGRSYELARMITGLDMIFQDSKGEEYEEWNTLEEERAYTLPSLISIRLTIKDQLGRVKTITTSVHPMLAELKQDE